MKKFCLLSAVVLFSIEIWANPQPTSLVFHEKPGATVVLVDKSECSVNVYQFEQTWKNIYKVGCDIGQVSGDKFREGDLKTPTGFYQLSKAWTGDSLLKKYGSTAKVYGAGAFELNYPNYLDKVFYKKTGYGIWLHGTDKDQPQATRGCISTTNTDLLKLAEFIELRQTPLIVEEKISYLPEEAIIDIQKKLVHFVEQWRSAWESDRTNDYLSFYSESFKTPKFNYSQWRKYKQRVNHRNKNRKILVKDLSVFKVKGIYNVQFIQKYTSSRINSIGKKYLYLIKQGEEYRVISERWEKLPTQPLVSPLQYVYQGKSKTFSNHSEI